jgi:uncharacterized protein (TIGR02594 family)
VIAALMRFLEALFAPVAAKPVPKPAKPEPDDLPWMENAKGEIGQKEAPGAAVNPKITIYHKAANYVATEVASWCSSFWCWCLEKSGLKDTNSAGAREASEGWGIELLEPIYGCTCVYNRGTTPSTAWQAHVAFFIRRDRKGWDVVLGGNQDDAVKYKEYQNSDGKLVGYFWPKDYPLPAGAKVKGKAA